MTVIGNKVNATQKAGKATVGESSVTVLAANENRNGCLIVNASSHTIYLSLGAPATAESGIALTAGGSWDGCLGDALLRGIVWSGSVTAICPGGGASNPLTVVEV